LWKWKTFPEILDYRKTKKESGKEKQFKENKTGH